MNINVTLLWQMVFFVIFVWFSYKFVWAPIIGAINARKTTIADGLAACRDLTRQNVKVNVTLCFTPVQALLAAKAGATFISPFIGRLDDLGMTGLEIIEDIREIYDNYGFATEILVASIRSPQHVRYSAKIGADVCTVPPKVLGQLMKHPLTDSGLEAFLADHKKSVG